LSNRAIQKKTAETNGQTDRQTDRNQVDALRLPLWMSDVNVPKVFGNVTASREYY